LWGTAVIPALGKLMLEDFEFKVILGYIARLSQKMYFHTSFKNKSNHKSSVMFLEHVYHVKSVI
jgi:hypothetical protein